MGKRGEGVNYRSITFSKFKRHSLSNRNLCRVKGDKTGPTIILSSFSRKEKEGGDCLLIIAQNWIVELVTKGILGDRRMPSSLLQLDNVSTPGKLKSNHPVLPLKMLRTYVAPIIDKCPVYGTVQFLRYRLAELKEPPHRPLQQRGRSQGSQSGLKRNGSIRHQLLL